MGRVRRAFLPAMMAFFLSGCAAATAVSAIPSVLVDKAVGFFNGQEASLPVGMQHALASVQQGLERMSLHVDVLEPTPEGYVTAFGNGDLDGDITLKRQTARLTTMNVSAHRGMTHERSVEAAMVKEVLEAAQRLPDDATFDFSAYRRVYARADSGSAALGWFRPGAMLEVKKRARAGWLKIKLPSGKEGFVRASLRGGRQSLTDRR